MPQLSEKEQAEYWATGRCFNCGEEGHISRNCHCKHSVQSGSGHSKPPRKSTFNVEPIQLMDDESDEILDSLPLGSISFEESSQYSPIECGPVNDWRDRYPYWSEPGIHARSEIRDCFVMVADTILTLQQPYPGDEIYDPDHMCPEL